MNVHSITAVPAYFEFDEAPDGVTLRAFGDWVIANLKQIDADLRALAPKRGGRLTIDLSGIEILDTAGAFVLHRTQKRFQESGFSTSLEGASSEQATLMSEVAANDEPCEREPPYRGVLLLALDRVGRTVEDAYIIATHLAGLMGHILVSLGQRIISPKKLRLTSVVHHMETAGLDAVPIVSLLAFLIGAVVAFIGARTLQSVGAEVFIVESVAIGVMRELGVVLTAILIAGRSGSAFTAEIGSMKANEEIDAMRTLGLDPIEVLVIPRVLALVLMMPFLTFIADVMGIFGGLLVAWAFLDISPGMFFTRMAEMVPISNFWVGMIKAPVFAFVIGLIGCHEGLNVEGSAESVGTHTTQSVVEAIFAVIVLDAAFALFFMEINW